MRRIHETLSDIMNQEGYQDVLVISHAWFNILRGLQEFLKALKNGVGHCVIFVYK